MVDPPSRSRLVALTGDQDEPFTVATEPPSVTYCKNHLPDSWPLTTRLNHNPIRVLPKNDELIRAESIQELLRRQGLTKLLTLIGSRATGRSASTACCHDKHGGDKQERLG